MPAAAQGAAPSRQAPATAPPPPTAAIGGFAGVWLDDTGQGAIELTPCKDSICGRVVWLRNPRDPDTWRPFADDYNGDSRLRSRPICGLAIIGGLKRQANGSWDAGWIYDPKQGKQFDLELKLIGPDTLQVTGYIGVKFLSQTFVWKRAPANLPRC